APAWLFILDVDDFKLINDNYGHAFGDEVIRYVASILQEEVGERGAVGRFGGDEFFVFLERVITREDLKTLLKVIAKELLIRFDPKVRLTASIGVSHYPEDGEDFETLFAKADKSLYIAKEKGKNRHIIYEEKLHGTLEGSSIESQAVSYALSKEKTRSKMSDLILQLSMKGAGYILEDPSVQESVRAIFDVDGLLIVADGGRKVLCRNGRYIRNLDPEILPDFLAEMAGRYDENGVYVENNVAGMKESSPNLYAIMQEYEIGAFLSYAGRKDGKIDAAVFFDIFNKKRKWSDRELDLMGILGNLLIRMIEGGL
ncbi:MAG: GGDEF domain-containing protein, partial [Lachnospiraceae bacterium]|nr:GGDEF domain-containing protein [Lachnospiraceae bacterium]